MSCSELYVDHPLWFLKHVAVAQCPCFAAEGSGAQRSEGDSAREPGHSLAVCGLPLWDQLRTCWRCTPNAACGQVFCEAARCILGRSN